MFAGQSVHEGLLVKSIPVYYVNEDVNSYDCAVCRKNRMEIQEEQEVSVVKETNTLINPDAMVIKLLYATLAHIAMLRSCRLFHFACLAFVFLLKHDSIRLEALNSFNLVFLVGLLVNAPWVDPTCHEVTCIAHKHEDSAGNLMIFINELIWHSWKSVLHINVESSKCAYKVNNLDERIRFITDPAS